MSELNIHIREAALQALPQTHAAPYTFFPFVHRSRTVGEPEVITNFYAFSCDAGFIVLGEDDDKPDLFSVFAKGGDELRVMKLFAQVCEKADLSYTSIGFEPYN